MIRIQVATHSTVPYRSTAVVQLSRVFIEAQLKYLCLPECVSVKISN